jgi:hypothetical protein
MLEQLGLVENGKDKKLKARYTSVNKKEKEEVDHKEIAHTFAIQRSGCISLDNDISRRNLLGVNAKRFLDSN